MDTARCKHCSARFTTPIDVFRHQVTVHPESNLAVVIKSEKKKRTRYYNTKADDIKCNIDNISIDSVTGKLNIDTRKPNESPVHKIGKIKHSYKTCTQTALP